MAAIQTVVDIFRGMERNTYDNAHNEDIHMNVCSLSSQQIHDNMQNIVLENGVPEMQTFLVNENDACIEMETGTRKNLTYLQLLMNCSNNMV